MDCILYKDYEIRICGAPPYHPDSADNKAYDKVMVVEDWDYEEWDYNKLFEIHVEHMGTEKIVLLVASGNTPEESFVALHRDGLLLMLNETLCIFNPETLAIVKQSSIEPLGTMFEIHPYKSDYILYGELEIYRVSSDLEVLWCFGARDIFVRYQGDEPAFLMKEDRICLYDWLGYYYEIDYGGVLIHEESPQNQS